MALGIVLEIPLGGGHVEAADEPGIIYGVGAPVEERRGAFFKHAVPGVPAANVGDVTDALESDVGDFLAFEKAPGFLKDRSIPLTEADGTEDARLAHGVVDTAGERHLDGLRFLAE